MPLFGLTRARPRVSAADATHLRAESPGAAPITLAVDRLAWVMFLHVGDAFFATEAGWWIFARPDRTALALSSDCPALEMTVRGPLRPALDGAGAKLLLELAQPPATLRGRPARIGWADLPAAAATALASDPTASRLLSVDRAPILP